MRLSNKLMAFAIVIALLAPALGVLTYVRVEGVAGRVHDLSDEGVPGIIGVMQMKQYQSDMQAAVLAYATTGRPQDKARYTDLAKAFAAELTKVQEHAKHGHGADTINQVERIAAEHKSFNDASARIFTGREAQEKGIGALRDGDSEILGSLRSIPARFLPSTSNPGPASAASVPQSLRYQINDLLLGIEAMTRLVQQQGFLATSYALKPEPAVRIQFDALSDDFNVWFNVAMAAGGPEDRAILEKVKSKAAEFRANSTGMFEATDQFSRARGVLATRGATVEQELDAFRAHELAGLDATHDAADAAVTSTQFQILGIALLGFALASLVGVWFVHAVTRPLTRLRDLTDQVSRGELDDIPLAAASMDEVGELTEAVRRMAQSLRYARHRLMTPIVAPTREAETQVDELDELDELDALVA